MSDLLNKYTIKVFASKVIKKLRNKKQQNLMYRTKMTFVIVTFFPS